MTESTDDTESPDLNSRGFLALLIGDVITATDRKDAQDTPANRRDLIRTTFAAIEGSTWLLREHVRSVARTMDVLTPIADMALRETSYTVDASGRVVEQVKFIALPTILRLTIAQAQLIDGRLNIDFGDAGWDSFRKAIAIRNRITHPKYEADLVIDDVDLATVSGAFSWLLSVTEEIMIRMVAEAALHARVSRALLDALKNGEPWALELYNRELNRSKMDT